MKLYLDPELTGPLLDLEPTNFLDVEALRADVMKNLGKFRQDSDDEIIITNEFLNIDGRDLKIRIYSPRGGYAGGLLWIHGGAFTLGSPEMDDDLCRHLAHKHQRLVISPDYRLSPENPYPAAKEDCLAAFNFLECLMNEDGKDFPVTVAGASAGGQLALEVVLETSKENCKIDRLIVLYPVVDHSLNTPSMKLYESAPIFSGAHSVVMWERYLVKDTKQSLWRSPLKHPNLNRLPFTLIVTVEHDPLRDEGLELFNKLLTLGVSVQSLHVAGAYHAFDRFAPDSKLSRDLLSEIDNFFHRKIPAQIELLL
jgi:acetyl esterase